jgi:hypothetical protein
LVLNIWGTDPKGTSFKIYGDANSNSIPAGQTRTLTVPSGTNFASNCSNCVPGTYTITAYYQINGNPVQLYTISGGSNPLTLTVNDNSNVATTAFNGNIDLFKHGSDNNIWTTYQVGGGWNSWAKLSPNGTQFMGTPSVVQQASSPSNTVIVFTRDINGQVWNNYNIAGAGWNGWGLLPAFPSGISAAGDPAAAIDKNNNGEVFVVGSDGNMWFTYTNQGAWASWAQIGSGSNFTGTPSVAIQGTGGGLILVAKNTSGTPFNTYQTSVVNGQSPTWNTWNNLGGTLVDDLKLIIDGNNNAEVYGIGTDGNVYEDYTNQGAWSGWQWVTPNGSHFRGEISPIMLNGTIVADVTDTNGTTYNNWEHWAPNGWDSWSNLGGTVIGDVTNAVSGSGTFYIFGKTSDGSIWYNCTVPGGWSGWQMIGFTG